MTFCFPTGIPGRVVVTVIKEGHIKWEVGKLEKALEIIYFNYIKIIILK